MSKFAFHHTCLSFGDCGVELTPTCFGGLAFTPGSICGLQDGPAVWLKMALQSSVAQ
jgi:hypothetical protein